MSKVIFGAELTDLALDLRAIADAEIDAEFVLSVHDFLEGVSDELPEPALFGLSEEDGCRLAAEVARVALSDDGAAEHGAWFATEAEICEALERLAG